MEKRKSANELKKCPRHEWRKKSYTPYHECLVCGKRKSDKLK